MTKNLQDLLEAAKNFVLTPEEKEQQRRSFAYGNTVIENPRVTRQMADRAAEELGLRNRLLVEVNADSSTSQDHSQRQ